ncbi:hypothetical protein Hypma_002387 [Hypsizygus marmoreus]|uniref:Uncharacterized protein n=1 Tax=Hypsizygus marmoreus TaxID=39966 RepID=A0A369J8J6_HYPMA|nr:hypothetical protein Hypma_002387 [Hypsizygus marmoreus]
MSEFKFPTPVGGTPFPSDFAPSVLFAALYGLLVPVMLYRMFHRSSRTILLFGSIPFSVERVVIFSLRAVMSRSESQRLSKGLVTYMQISFGLGFIGLASDLVKIIRCLVVNPTYGSETYAQSPAAETEASYRDRFRGTYGREGFLGPPPEGTPDYPRRRFWARRFSDFAGLAFLAATVPGIVANVHFSSIVEDPSKGDKTMLLRYVSSGVALFLTCILGAATVWARCCLTRVSRRGTLIIANLTILLSVIGIYRLRIMYNTTPSLLSIGPGSLNSPGDKAGFYVLHVLPEWLTNAILVTVNIKQMLGTGMWGDWRFRDETPDERAKRERKEATQVQRRSPRPPVSNANGCSKEGA